MEEFKRNCGKLFGKDEVILDNGGGSGICTDVLREQKITDKIYALDISPTVLKERDPRYICTVGDMENLPYTDGFFDRVFFAAALHHVKNTKKALDEAKRVLKPNGHVVLVEPVSLKLRILGQGIRPTPDGVEFSFSLPYVLRHLKQSGFIVERIYYQGFLKRFLRKSGSKTLRLASRTEDLVNNVPLIREISSIFSNFVSIVARKNS